MLNENAAPRPGSELTQMRPRCRVTIRLHTRHDYPGTGIGLAVCKRIVTRHRGRARSSPRCVRGAAFSFSIPDRPEKEAPST